MQEVVKLSEQKERDSEKDLKKLTKDISFLKLYVKKKNDEVADIAEKNQNKYDKLLDEYKVVVNELKTTKDTCSQLEAYINDKSKDYKQKDK